MIRATVTGVEESRSFLVHISGSLADPRPLNEALGLRLTEELKAHFIRKNSEGRKPGSLGARLNGPKSNFWQKIADATALGAVTSAGATVNVAENRFAIHLFGGTILPGPGKKALTIPLITEAVGKRVANYMHETGKRLFRIPGRDVLFEKADENTATESRVGATRTRGRNRTLGMRLRPRQGIRAVFALKKSVTIEKDPDALPSMALLTTALQEEADDFLDAIQQTQGGAP